MPVFLERFGIYDPTYSMASQTAPSGGQGVPYYFSNVRSGLIVALLSIGTLIGALSAAPLANRFGRRGTIPFWVGMFCVGVVIQMAVQSGQWVGIVMGRWVAGLGVGGLSVLTPLYISESTPKQVRGAAVCSYQLFITIGIFVADAINYGTESLTNTASYRIPMGIGFVWAIILIVGILLMPESPRYDIVKGRHERALRTMTKFYGVPLNHRAVHVETQEINKAIEAASGDHPWYEVFTGPRMLYRVLLGMSLQAFQQLTGANYFFYYGTTIFAGVGIQNSYVTAMILGGVNVVCTFPGLYMVEKFGRRKCLFFGALFQAICFLIFASIGHFQFLPASLNGDTATEKSSGTVMIVFACLFIASFAATWGPMVWYVVVPLHLLISYILMICRACIGDMYPYRYRAAGIALATSANWGFNFLLAFFTPFITGDIDYQYGYVFAACNFSAALTVYFFLIESQGRTLEEVDYMYIIHVPPTKSSKWDPKGAGENVNTDQLYLSKGGRDITKREEGARGGVVQDEGLFAGAEKP